MFVVWNVVTPLPAHISIYRTTGESVYMPKHLGMSKNLRHRPYKFTAHAHMSAPTFSHALQLTTSTGKVFL
jgi:hypothetical protein